VALNESQQKSQHTYGTAVFARIARLANRLRSGVFVDEV
jgi:hypothetical protein